jgi:hypothetical protein
MRCKICYNQLETEGCKVKISTEAAIRNAEASLKMEGMQPSEEILSECRRVLNGEITYEQYIAIIREMFMAEADRVEIQP